MDNSDELVIALRVLVDDIMFILTEPDWKEPFFKAVVP